MSKTGIGPVGNTYPKYETHHGIERRMVSGFLRRLDRALAGPPPRRVLDVGVGEGFIVEHVPRLPAGSVVGVDLYDEDLVRQWRRRRVTGVVGDACQLPFPDESFDLILAIEVLEHLNRPELALAEIARVGCGRVVLSVPQEPLWRIGNLLRCRYWPAWGNTPGHVQHWGSRAFERLVSRHLRVVARWHPPPWTIIVAEAPHPTRLLPRA